MRWARDMMRWVVVGGGGAFGFGIGSAAYAEPCGNVTATGICFDAKTVLFCDNGVLQTMACGAGETCDVSALFNGVAACVGTRYTGCGDVSETGQCADNTLLYCEGSRVKKRTCADGTTCAWVPEENWYDCVGVPSSGAPYADTSGERRTEDAGAPTESDAGTNPSFLPDTDSNASDASGSDDTIPADDTGEDPKAQADSGPSLDQDPGSSTPTVLKGGAKPASQYAVSGAGCAASGAAPDAGLLLALVLGLVGLSLRTGRRSVALAKSKRRG